jgi:type IV secretion system protein VirB3
MIAGVPLLPAIFIFAFFVLGSLVLAALFGIAGLLFFLPAIPIFLFMRSMCETDDQALRIIGLELFWFMHRLRSHVPKTLTFTPIKYGRVTDVYKRYF